MKTFKQFNEARMSAAVKLQRAFEREQQKSEASRRRGEEVMASVIDGPKSVIWREAFHRRTTIQSLLFHLTRGEIKGSL